MKHIFSITSDPLSILKLKLLDGQFGQIPNIGLQVVFIGSSADLEEILEELDQFENNPMRIDVEPTSSTQETARAFLECETLFSIHKIDFILVPDASNAAFASAMVGIKEPVPVLNLEAGLRRHDRRLPEEINRRAIDSISELFFTSEPKATENLKEEGVDEKNIHERGNLLEEFFSSKQANKLLNSSEEAHILCYFSHPSNAKDPILYKELFSILKDLAFLKEIVLPLDEQTQKTLSEQELLSNMGENIRIFTKPSAKELIDLIKDSALVLTDDGMTQILSSALQKQCISFGNNSEYQSTIEFGTNHLIGTHLHEMRNLAVAILEGYKKQSKKVSKQQASSEITKVISLL